MESGSANQTFCVTFHNFSCLILDCLLCYSQLMSFFFLPWLGIFVEVDQMRKVKSSHHAYLPPLLDLL